ncbi:hypothetical protein, partial [Oleidesulfovibrio alaskensis]
LKPAAPAAVAAAESALCLLSISLSTTFFTFFPNPLSGCGSVVQRASRRSGRAFYTLFISSSTPFFILFSEPEK